jgi:parallel beta-helix repeat protein
MQNVIWKKGIVIGIVLLFFGASVIPVIKADPVIIYVDDDNITGPWLGTLEYPFWSIQDGVDAANDGDTVYVFSGTYIGNVNVYKSIDFIGEDKQTTILDGNNDGHTVVVSANDVQIAGFTVSNSGNEYPDSGIYLVNVENTLITGTILSNNNGYGLFIGGGSLNTVENTTASFNGYAGIRVDSSLFTVTNNTLENNDEDGIFLYSASQGLLNKNIPDMVFLLRGEALRSPLRRINALKIRYMG